MSSPRGKGTRWELSEIVVLLGDDTHVRLPRMTAGKERTQTPPTIRTVDMRVRSLVECDGAREHTVISQASGLLEYYVHYQHARKRSHDDRNACPPPLVMLSLPVPRTDRRWAVVCCVTLRAQLSASNNIGLLGPLVPLLLFRSMWNATSTLVWQTLDLWNVLAYMKNFAVGSLCFS